VVVSVGEFWPRGSSPRAGDHCAPKRGPSSPRRATATEKINESYVSRVLRLSLLIPNIVEAIMGGLQPAAVTLEVSLQPFALEWTEQRRRITPCW
jgi:hypothetical protein